MAIPIKHKNLIIEKMKPIQKIIMFIILALPMVGLAETKDIPFTWMTVTGL